ncbi:MAG: putative glycosyltransferase [Capsulimonas sp.]|jgi:GT2 family glycosyltransferase|nr:putative glycosyltransferase [Capsulimonas sp.]
MTDIAVIIVNWNAQKDLRVCLQSLFSDPRPKVDYEVWVVDNDSADGSADMVRSEFPEVRLIANNENTGFSKANNQAIAQSQSRYVFLLNSDAYVHEGAIDQLVEYADAHPQAGIIGPRVLNEDGTLQFSCRRFPSLMAGFFRNTLLGKIAPQNKYAAEYLMWDISHDKDQTVDWISGCAMLIRRTLIDRIGALDERFFMYCEDVDICRRTWEDGFEVRYAPEAVVSHIIGRSSDNNAEKMIVEFHRSWYEYDLKHHPHGGPGRRAVVYSGLWLRGAVRIARRRSNQKRQAKIQQERGS